MLNTGIFLATSFQDTLWIVLLIIFAVVFYNWSKSKMANSTVAVIVTLLLTYIVFIRYTELVWILAIGIVIYWIYGSEIKNAIKIKI